MEKFKGTKGKWLINTKEIELQVFNEDSLPFYAIDIICHHKNIILVPTDLDKDEARANAKLIASAPEMLEMLEKLISHYGEDGFVGLALRSDIDNAQQLISKITE